MTSHECTCADPKKEVCHTHRTFKISQWRWFKMRVQYYTNMWNCQFRWWLAERILGELFYQTSFICPKCGNHYCPARPEEK